MRLLKTRRQSRYKFLTERGFTDREATEFSRIRFTLHPLHPPYIRALIRSRIPLFASAQKRGLTRKQYIARIFREYDRRGWITPTGKLDVWRLFRFCEDKYRESHPEYESPWQGRRKRFTKWRRAYEGGLAERQKHDEKYPRGAAYHR